MAQELVIQGTLDVSEATGADFDGSGIVDGLDFLAWQRGNGDADGDSDSDGIDLGLWQQQYGTAGSGVGQTKTLTSDWIHVNSGGVFQIGTAANRYDQGEFVLTLNGTNQNADYTVETATGTMQINDNDGFLMAAMGGRLQFFGQDKLSFTKLGQTAEVGANSIVVENVIERNFDGTTSAASDGQLNWEVGDQIVIASSSRDYSDQEVRTITAITDLGNGTTRLTLDSLLSNRHYGEIETYDNGTRSIDMRAEVALLSRNVRIQGLASQDTDSNWGNRALFNTGSTGDNRGISGHIMIMGTAGQISVEGVQLDRLGQTGTLGRYPFHWHRAGDRTGDVLKGVSITNSNNRGVTVHATDNLLIQDVVLHDIQGHGFFMEDAVETGNQYLSNITFGIHKVGRSDAVGDNDPDLNDPFIVDTHDVVGQNPIRFLSSAGFWMTSPDNTWIGNVSAGSEGTGYWFIFPDFPIGVSASDPQYNGVEPDEVDLGQFDHNSSHSSPIGLNFDRGSDIEVPIGATLKDNFDGDQHNPTNEPQINYYTAYQHTTGIYHRARKGNFYENRFADNFTSTFITFTQRITDSLYVGHSTGNSDPGQIVTGHTFYDGANTLDGTHFAGFNTSNAHTYRTNGVAIRHTHFVMRNTSFENDGSANNFSYSDVNGIVSSYNPVGKTMPSVIYDEDGTLTSHVGGQAGSTVIPDHPFFYDANDFKPAGWNARISDDLYSVFRMRSPTGQDPLFRITTPDGNQGQDNPGTGLFAGTNTLMKLNDGDYVVDFPLGNSTASDGFDILYFITNGPQTGSTVVKFEDMASDFSVGNRPFLSTLNDVRNATQTSWTVVGNDLYVNFFSALVETDRVVFAPAATTTVTLWEDTSPPDNADGSAVSKIADPFGTGMGDIGRWITNGQPQFHNINPDGPDIDVSSYDGWNYAFSFDYYIDSSQTLTDDTFYLNAGYGATNFNIVNSGAALDSWTTVIALGVIDTSSSTTVNPLIITNHKNTTETTPSFYIDNVKFTVSTSPLSALGGGSGPSAASSALMGIELNSSAGLSEQQNDELLVDPQGAFVEASTSKKRSSRDTAFAALAEPETEVAAAKSADQQEAEEEWLDGDLLEAVFG